MYLNHKNTLWRATLASASGMYGYFWRFWGVFLFQKVWVSVEIRGDRLEKIKNVLNIWKASSVVDRHRCLMTWLPWKGSCEWRLHCMPFSLFLHWSHISSPPLNEPQTLDTYYFLSRIEPIFIVANLLFECLCIIHCFVYLTTVTVAKIRPSRVCLIRFILHKVQSLLSGCWQMRCPNSLILQMQSVVDQRERIMRLNDTAQKNEIGPEALVSSSSLLNSPSSTGCAVVSFIMKGAHYLGIKMAGHPPFLSFVFIVLLSSFFSANRSA